MSGTNMLVGATIDFLRRYSPFDRMETEALDYLSARLKLAYFHKDSPILTPEQGIPTHLYIVQRGKVLRREAGEVATTMQLSLTMGAGECFPIGSVMGQRASTNNYTAIDDVFCYQLAAEDFFHLINISPAFNLFCTRYIASLLSQSQQQLQLQFAQRASEQQTMNSPLSAIIKKTPAAVVPEATLRGVLETMAASHIGSMIVIDAESRPVGIFTQSDVLKRIVLPGLSLDKPIREVMSPDPQALPLTASVYDAALAMAMYGIRHVLVVDAEGRLCGVVSERDLFALQRVGLRQIRQSIESAPDLETLRQASADVRQLAFNMLAQGVGAEQLTQFISTLNDSLNRRIIELNLERHDLFGIEWAWLSFGSEGRDEQTFSTDQDNGIIYLCPDIMDREQLQLRFLEFARDVNRDLDACGFPLCKGNIMAGNPEWCLTLEEWQEKFSNWVRSPEPQALLNATIFFDFRPLYGKQYLADRLRLFLLGLTQSNPLFLRMMVGNALDVEPPLGMFRDFVTDLDADHPGTIDLKKYGARLFVDAARIYALASGVHNSNTPQRLRQAAAKLGINQDEIAAMIEAFNFIQLLRLRHQHLERGHGLEGDNRIKPEELNELDRRILKESFRQARKLQQRLKLDYQT